MMPSKRSLQSCLSIIGISTSTPRSRQITEYPEPEEFSERIWLSLNGHGPVLLTGSLEERIVSPQTEIQLPVIFYVACGSVIVVAALAFREGVRHKVGLPGVVSEFGALA
jgi:hypothetical protein